MQCNAIFGPHEPPQRILVLFQCFSPDGRAVGGSLPPGCFNVTSCGSREASPALLRFLAELSRCAHDAITPYCKLVTLGGLLLARSKETGATIEQALNRNDQVPGLVAGDFNGRLACELKGAPHAKTPTNDRFAVRAEAGRRAGNEAHRPERPDILLLEQGEDAPGLATQITQGVRSKIGNAARLSDHTRAATANTHGRFSPDSRAVGGSIRPECVNVTSCGSRARLPLHSCGSSRTFRGAHTMPSHEIQG